MSYISQGNKLSFEGAWYNSLLGLTSEKRSIIEYLISIFLTSKPKRVLEVGMGTSPIFAERIGPIVPEYTIIEKSQPLPRKLPKNIHFIKDNFEKKSLKSKYDAIILSHVIYYFENLDYSLDKAYNALEKGGTAYFVLNGPEKHYGAVKKIFSELTGIASDFTYSKLMKLISKKGLAFTEKTIEVSIDFSCYDDLFEAMKLFFDLYPNEFILFRPQILDWLKLNVENNQFVMDQKIIGIKRTG